MIFGSKALAVAVLGSLVFIGEASASKLKGANKGLRNAMEVAAVDNMASDGSVDPDAQAPTCGDVGVSTLFIFSVSFLLHSFRFRNSQVSFILFVHVCRSHSVR